MSDFGIGNSVIATKAMRKISMFFSVAIFLLPVSCSIGSAESYSVDQLRKERKEAAFRQRRIIVNNDGNENPELPVTPESFLKSRTSGGFDFLLYGCL